MDRANIRPFEARHQRNLLAFLRRCLLDLGFEFEPHGKDRDVRDVRTAYVDNRGSFHVLEAETQVVGSVGVRRLSGETAELKRLYVDQPFRGLGYGRALCEAAMEAAAALGYRTLRLDTTTRSPEAIALFRKLGFEEIDRYNDDPFAELFMERSLP